VDNAAANGLSGKFRVIHGDFKSIHAGLASVRTVFCNPPFFKAGQGRLSPDRTIRLARFDIAMTLDDVLRCSAAVLAPKGTLCLIFPHLRQQELLVSAAVHGLYPERMRPVQPFADAPPDRFLVRLGKTRKRCAPEKPLVIFREKGAYTPEMDKILSGA
jgi:tRNA1(Val) A37 N6-methylase TrmN6